jgi:TRAP transporter TAXI family solute receptor
LSVPYKRLAVEHTRNVAMRVLISIKKNTLKMTSGVLAILLLSTTVQSDGENPTHYTIGTGSKGATFYPLVKALCTRIGEKNYDFTCEAVSTPGSIYNVNAIENGEHALALSQLPIQYQSFKGLNPFQTAHKRIATVAPLHQEVFILAVNPSSNIKMFSDIKTKRVNIGNTDSGSRVIIEQLFDYMGWSLSEFKIYSEKSLELPRLLCNGKIDAAIYSTGHPNSIYEKMIQQCGVELVDLWDENIAKFVEKHWQFVPATIPASSYPAITVEKFGFGVQVVLSANSEISSSHIYQIVQTIVEDKSILAKYAPIFRTIKANNYPLKNAAPYHNGAKMYYQENALSTDR